MYVHRYVFHLIEYPRKRYSNIMSNFTMRTVNRCFTGLRVVIIQYLGTEFIDKYPRLLTLLQNT